MQYLKSVCKKMYSSTSNGKWNGKGIKIYFENIVKKFSVFSFLLKKYNDKSLIMN